MDNRPNTLKAYLTSKLPNRLLHNLLSNLLSNKRTYLVPSALVMLVSIALSACQSQAAEKNMINNSINIPIFTQFERNIAQRMSLDIRYFCPDVNGKASVPTSKHCRQAVTELPKELAQMISTSNVGGIVLFAENVQEIAQVVKLTHDIQQAAVKSAYGKPLIIMG